MMLNNSLYGNFRTRSFSEIFSTKEEFVNYFTEINLVPKFNSITTENRYALERVYLLLLSRYANSHIASSDENRFKLQLAAMVDAYGPTWYKKVEVQERLRELSVEEVMLGTKAIHNHSYNPSTAPSTSTLEELTTINEQNTTKYVKNKVEGYDLLLSLLDDTMTDIFLNRFKPLFLMIVEPELPLWYTTEINNTEETLII